MADLIDKLPIDETPLDTSDITILENVFKDNSKDIDNIVYNMKDILIAGGIFTVVSLPVIQTVLNKLLPVTRNSDYISIVIKAIVFMLALYVITYFNLAKKK
jgi:hypothetical protein